MSTFSPMLLQFVPVVRLKLLVYVLCRHPLPFNGHEALRWRKAEFFCFFFSWKTREADSFPHFTQRLRFSPKFLKLSLLLDISSKARRHRVLSPFPGQHPFIAKKSTTCSLFCARVICLALFPPPPPPPPPRRRYLSVRAASYV